MGRGGEIMRVRRIYSLQTALKVLGKWPVARIMAIIMQTPTRTASASALPHQCHTKSRAPR